MAYITYLPAKLDIPMLFLLRSFNEHFGIFLHCSYLRVASVRESRICHGTNFERTYFLCIV